VFEMHPADAAAAVKAGGAVASMAGVTRRSVGYRCGGCGFGSYTVTCSRCGGECTRE
jgi:lipopolysaccharide biosynthesis regulator YciM